MNDRVKINIIIPTRERADTLFYCLRSVVTQKYDNLNIIVSDNFSQDNTKEVVDSFADSRITYINTGKRISMSHNWEFALNHVTEGWVTILGDDDGLLPGALMKISEIVEQTKCQAIVSKWCLYNWPNSCLEDRLVVPLTSGIDLRDGQEWLGKLMNGDTTYPELPHIYTGGFADISIINKARNSKGIFFLSMTPDVYSGIALVSVLDSYIKLNEPLSIAGISSHSNGASALGFGKYSSPAQKFFSEPNILFHNLLVGGEYLQSIPILVYECYLQAIHLHKNFLNVKLEEQLVLALALANIQQENTDNLRKYCIQIAANNNININFNNKLQIKKIKKISLYIQRLKEEAKNNCAQVIISGTDFGVQDVYGATILSKGIYTYGTVNSICLWINYFRILKRTIQKRVFHLGFNK